MATPSKSATSPSGGQRKSAGARKTSAKKSSPPKPSAKKANPERSSARAPRPEARAGSGSDESGSGERRRSSAMSAMKIARAAAQQLAELTGRRPECVIGIERAEEGWTVELEVVESRRVPDSTDILATYRVQVDEDGELMAYHRAERYVRGKGGSRDGGR